MKKSLLHTLVLIIVLIANGCTDNYDPNGNLKPSLSAHYLWPSETIFYSDKPTAFSRSFKVESYETPWGFTDVADWFSVTPASGTGSMNISLDVQENVSALNNRTSIFYLQSSNPDWNYNRALSVSQAKAVPFVTIESSSLSFGGAASTQTIKVSSNCSWKASCVDSWINLSYDTTSGTLTVTVSSNSTDKYRSGVIYITYDEDKTLPITVTQSPSEISVSVSKLEYENYASKYDVTITSETAWMAIASESWIIINPERGEAGSTSVSIEVSPNTAISSRRGFVTISTGDSERLQIEILQKGIYIETDETLSFSSKEETKLLTVRSNTSWSVISKPNWITLSPVSGVGSGEISVTVLDNPNTSPRSGEIVISQPGISVESRVMVTQEGKNFATGVTLLEFSDKAGTMNFGIVSDASWNSTQTADWFSVDPVSGNGDATITVEVEENISSEERIGTIKYVYADKTADVNVHQLAKYMTIDNKTFEFDSKGGNHTIELSTNDEWYAEIEHNETWLKLSQNSGSGNAIITLTAEENASVNTRSTAVVITTKNSQSVRILVSQRPMHLSVSTQSLLFFSKGGTSEIVTVDTEGTFEIKTDGSWFTVNRGEGNTFTVYASKNNQNETRIGKITISLTNLKEGSLSLTIDVIQAGDGGTFIIEGYPEDGDWNTVGQDTLYITLNGYTADKNWDSAGGSKVSIQITGFTTDHDWNIDDASNCRATIVNYGYDRDWNQSAGEVGSFSKEAYSADNNWNN